MDNTWDFYSHDAGSIPARPATYFFMFKLAISFLVCLAGCTQYSETTGVVSQTGQCTRYRCSYTISGDGFTLFAVSYHPMSVGVEIPVKYSVDEKGIRSYFLDRKFHTGY